MSNAAVATASPAPSSGSDKRVTMNGPVEPHAPSGGRPRSRPLGSAQERLTPMPGYMRPIVKSAVRKWKKLHEDHMMDKLMSKRGEKKELNQVTREDARKLAKKIPMEVLAKDWLNDNRATIETRAFLVEKVLPTLITGCEKLLIEVDRRQLAQSEATDSSFNPINFLGQYLMRNNPRYSNFSEASPYIRGLREIGEELKKQLFDIEDNRLARIKAEAQRRREDRETAERMRIQEKQRREDLLRRQFNEWNVGYFPNSRVELCLLQNALRLFAEMIDMLPEELRSSAHFSQDIGPTDDTGKTISQKEFVAYITGFVEGMTPEVFSHFIAHMNRCATAYRAQNEREQRRVTLSQLFMSCDNAGVGLLDRHRILNLFEMFYDKAKDKIQDTLRNPREWPVVDVQEVMSEYGDEEEPKVDGKAMTTEAATEAKTEETAAEGKDKAEEPPAEVPESAKTDGKPSTDGMTEGEEKTDKSKSSEEEKVDQVKEQEDKDKEIKVEEGAEPALPAEEERKAEKTTPESAGGKVESSTDTSVEGAGEEIKNEAAVEKTEAAGEANAENTEKAQEVALEEKKDEEATKEEKAVDGEEKKDETKPVETEEANKEAAVKPTEEVQGETEPAEVKGEPKEQEGAASDEPKPASNEAPETEPVSDKEKATSELPEKEKDEAEPEVAQTTQEDRAATAEDERDPELANLADGDEAKSHQTAGTANSLERPPMTQQSKVSFAEGTNFERERTSVAASRNSRSQSQASAFDENTLNVSQFVHMIETFLGDVPNMEAFHQLVRFIKTGYMETEEERMQRLFKARQEAQEAKRKALLNSLFEMWDNDGSGHIDFEEVETIMKKYKEGQETDAINQAKKEFKKKTRIVDNRINKREFRDFVHRVVEKMSGEDAFDYFVEFMLNSVEYMRDNSASIVAPPVGSSRNHRRSDHMIRLRLSVQILISEEAEVSPKSADLISYRSYAERVRGEARKKWLQQIVSTAYTSGASMEPVYKAVFQALYKDAETHGHNKVISANIAMLERNDIVADRGDFMLRYVAATPDDAPHVLGRALFKDMKGISFASVDSGKPLHVPRVSNHGNIHFWNPERDEADGSFIVVPLKDRKKRVFGLLGVDTLNDPHSRALFITHEIQFFQGITKSFSIAYHHVDVRQKTMRISESAVSWIHRRSPHVHEITVYMVEPDGKGLDYVLRKMMTTDHKGTTGLKKNPPKLERRDNLFRDYLFKCVDNSESITADAYGERHLAIPLRDDEGLAIVVVDISIGELKALPRNENREVMKMLRLLQTAYKEISHESKEGERTMVIEGDKLDDDSRTEILFDRLMLLELRENVSKLAPTAYAELKSYVDPPRVVHMIVKAVLSIFYPDKAREGEFNSWSQCKQYVTPQLSDQIKVYDPTSDLSNDNVPVEMIHADLEEVPHGQVYKHGSIPAQYLYNWVFVCISLIEHSRKMRNSSRSDLLTEIPPPVKKREVTHVSTAPLTVPAEQTMMSMAESKDETQTQAQTEASKEAPKETPAPPATAEESK